MTLFTPGNFLAVATGAAFGAILRWLLGLALNQESWPWGTLLANCLGGLFIGMLIGFFSLNEHIPLWVRLLLVTGFLGGLTTFSTFSAETLQFLLKGQFLWAGAYMGISLASTLLLTAVGMWLVRLFK
ncbi:putative fluoride ion transporter CrcB [Advenella faeciporci]|uniref:Fluoride-specific ion channel FluC n=1 Tax=Advenella faeciporci TaxID=797535 RepID=A0A918JGX2_9BURK|nr:fluoride efflux transporter CrcB [Advenella faeciporci]GGW79512.1 putative fluoride ion transporter CrcB [Advenella faeciporci]